MHGSSFNLLLPPGIALNSALKNSLRFESSFDVHERICDQLEIKKDKNQYKKVKVPVQHRYHQQPFHNKGIFYESNL